MSRKDKYLHGKLKYISINKYTVTIIAGMMYRIYTPPPPQPFKKGLSSPPPKILQNTGLVCYS